MLLLISGMAADVGTLQRLPHAIGSRSLANELCFTARKMFAPEAKDCGFVSQVFKDRDRYRLTFFVTFLPTILLIMIFGLLDAERTLLIYSI